MKFILSRKGFDSESGGHPSPILPDGRMLSIPIPSGDSIYYNDLKLGFNKYQTYCDLMRDLMPVIKIGGKSREVNENTRCHLDPDLNRDVRNRPNCWLPMFGQIDAAETHLENMGVEENDVFLFFGTFRKTQFTEGKIIFNRADRDKHVIFGYLQIGEILRCDLEANVNKWMAYHPHCDMVRRGKSNNTIYIARENLSWNKEISGAGTFNFDKTLVLTKEGRSKSIWCLEPSIFKDVNISYHSKKSWKGDCFQSVGRGQEFVIDENMHVEKYFRELIERID